MANRKGWLRDKNGEAPKFQRRREIRALGRRGYVILDNRPFDKEKLNRGY